MAVHKPSWFSDEYVVVSTAPTCGLTKGGRTLKKIDPLTGYRLQTTDPETGSAVDAIDDRLLEDMQALVRLDAPQKASALTDTLNFIPADKIQLNCAVPAYYDHRYHDRFQAALESDPEFKDFTSATLGHLQKSGRIIIRGGHGSPSQEQRIGDVPYIKVSDLRAGQVNINPTNRVPKAIAERYWGASESGLQAFDLVCPERTSKNIGDFCVLMPGQEQVLMTKEIIVLRSGPESDFDIFYVLWAMTLKIVREQWRRVVFMQTNREDVGKRYLEIAIPLAPNRTRADAVSKPFRDYYTKLAEARTAMQTYLADSEKHHFFVSGAATETIDEEQIVA